MWLSNIPVFSSDWYGYFDTCVEMNIYVIGMRCVSTGVGRGEGVQVCE